MDRDDFSAALIAEMGAVFMAALEELLPTLLTSVLAPMEQRGRQMGRVVLGTVMTRVAATQGDGGERGACPACGGRL